MKLSTFAVDVRFCLKPPATDGKATPQQKKDTPTIAAESLQT